MSRKFASTHHQNDYDILPDRIMDKYLNKTIQDLNEIPIEIFRYKLGGYCIIRYDASTPIVGYTIKYLKHSSGYPMNLFTDLSREGNSDETNKYIIFRFMGRGGRAPVFEDYTATVMRKKDLNKEPSRFNKYV